ncbi:MAG: topoisomerase DNA-binding C4 zinc finger domain-containing protein [Chloroflexi bacterium]|nr:topoisomerase DNA-binding C4 zinc finger domain-containing protein [Chloroflexota bacterium]MBV9603149.1 topoisomerase DNA-binding C4 zinc finger domain-containing protein [Chloroflexota bacterium]
MAVECDGHPSHFRADGSYTTDDIQRHVVLRRAGWAIYRIPLSTWRTNADGHLEAIANLLDNQPPRSQRTTPTLPSPDLTASAVPGGAPTRKLRDKLDARPQPAPTGKQPKVSVSAANCSCGGRWVLRNGRFGKFYGCSRYPRCRNTRRYGLASDVRL